MKKTIISFLSLMLMTSISFGQNSDVGPPMDTTITNALIMGTTMQEYNYITKGYKSSVIDQGLDMKSGYELELVTNTKISDRTVVLYKVIKATGKKNLPKVTVAYMAVYKYSSNPDEYICIPHPNSELAVKQAYFDNLYSSSRYYPGGIEQRLRILLYVLSATKMCWEN